MSQQSQPRPWFRLASLARPSSAPLPAAPAQPQPQPQAQAPASRPPFIRPTLIQTFAPPPPPQAPTQPLAPPQAPIQTPPSPQLPTRPLATAPPSPVVAPPRAATTPPPSPVVAPLRATTTPPPSPVVAPPRATTTPPPSVTKPSNLSPKPSPMMSTTNVTQSPKPRISSPPSPMPTRLASPTLSPSLPPPPPPSKAATPPSSRITTANVTPPLPSPQVSKYNEPKTPSPKAKLLTPPPSPLTLPSPQRANSDHESNKMAHPEIEQKIVMVHEKILENATPITKDNHNNLHTTPANHSKKERANLNVNPHKKFSDSEDVGMSVITLAGENRGAIMEFTPSRFPGNGHFATNRHHKIGSHDKLSSDGEKVASDSEGKGKRKDKNKSAKTNPFHAYTNSNVQGVNNSIMYNSSCTHNDPGVHLSVSRKPKDPLLPHHV